MTIQSYGMFCGLAKAVEIIGSRWSVTIIRDLILGPKRVADLRETTPGISSADLDARLDELETAGVVHRGGRDDRATVELTGYGRDLEPILLQLGRWGARALGDPRPGDIFTLDMAILALRATFRPERAAGVHAGFELWFGPMVVHALVDDGALTVREGTLPGADLVINSPVLKHMMAGELSPTDALWLELVETKGNPRLLSTFVELFHIPPAPERPAFALSEGRAGA
ncbi:winged helix-turn-helix transcriptional regulator [Actinophytocola sp. KF-1]